MPCPARVKKCVDALVDEGMPLKRAWAICVDKYGQGEKISLASFEELCPECIKRLTKELMAIGDLSEQDAKLKAITLFNDLMSDKDGG